MIQQKKISNKNLKKTHKLLQESFIGKNLPHHNT